MCDPGNTGSAGNMRLMDDTQRTGNIMPAGNTEGWGI